MRSLVRIAEAGLIPDALLRIGIRRLLAKRLSGMTASAPQTHASTMARFARELRQSPLAVATDAANQQHYEVPAEFFASVLGPRLKYSSCYYSDFRNSLAEAEDAMLRLTCERAEIEDGMRVFDLGCGWGSLSLWIAEHYPNCRVTAVSNSSSQQAFIEGRAASQGNANLQVMTADMRNFSTDLQFDRIVSVEMFEHMRNYELLFRHISKWLTPAGKLFVHVFCHRNTPYLFETEGPADWMGRHFFTGGMMPSEDLFGCFTDDLVIQEQWRVNGMHYWRTCEAWLANLDRNRKTILSRVRQDLSAREAKRNLQRWRMFFLACAELFRWHDGEEWFVAHYLFQHRTAKNAEHPARPRSVANK